MGNARLTYEELLTTVIEVEMILNSRPLSYVSSEDIEEPLTPSHLLCGFRVLSLPDLAPGDSEDDTSVSNDDLTRRMKHLRKTLSDFWKRWKGEYLHELREAHRHFHIPKGVSSHPAVGDVVIIHDENLPRGLWKLGKIVRLLTGVDGNVRGAVVRTNSRNRNSITLNRPVQRLFPLEFNDQVKGVDVHSQMDTADVGCTAPTNLPTHDAEADSTQPTAGEPEVVNTGRPRRRAFLQAQDTLSAWCHDKRYI